MIKCEDKVWKVLCSRRWPNSSLDPSFLEPLGGHRALCRLRRSTLLLPWSSTEEPEPLPPPQLKPEEFIILVDVSVNGENLYSGLHPGESLIDDFLEDGSFSVSLDEPCILGFHEREISYHLKMHLIRLVDEDQNCCCCIYDRTLRYTNLHCPYIYFGPNGWYDAGLSFRQTATATEITRRLNSPHSFRFSFHVNLYFYSQDGGKVAYTGLEIFARLGGQPGYDWAEFDSGISEESEVTILHILEQLQGTRFDSTSDEVNGATAWHCGDEPTTRQPIPRQASKHPRITHAGEQEEARKQTEWLASIITPLVQNGCIEEKELGRLERTCKRIKCEDEVWKVLCFHRWYNSSSLDPCFIERHGGYRALCRFRKTSSLLPIEKPKPLTPPQLKPEEFGILIDVSINEENVYSCFHPGTELVNDFLKEGCFSVSLDHPYILGNARCWFGEYNYECGCEEDCKFDPEEFRHSVKMYLIRWEPVREGCCIYDTTTEAPDWDHCEGIDMDMGEDGLYDWKNSTEERLSFSPNWDGLSFRQTATAAEITRRLNNPYSFRFSFCVDLHAKIVKPGKKLAITGLEIKTAVCGDDGDTDCGAYSATWGVFDSQKSEDSGIRMLHILEHLQSIRFDSSSSTSDESEDGTD